MSARAIFVERHKELRSRMGLLVAAFLTASGSFAGTIINTNLPAGDIIVNIGGTTDGAAAYSGTNQNFWYQPFNTGGDLLEVTLAPGTYTFRILDETDAASLFPLLTSAQLGEMGGGAWTFNTPWSTDYMVFDSSAATNPEEPQLFSGAINRSGTTFSSASAAYNAAISGGYYDQIVTNGGRYTGTVVNQYTISSTETLIFAVPDYYLADNAGIESVLISGVSSVSAPEPGTSGMLMVGIAGLALLRRRFTLQTVHRGR